MSKNRGTFEGNIEEKNFAVKFNSNKSSKKFEFYLSNFDHYDTKDVFMVRVTTKQPSKLSEKTVHTRADAYLIYSKDTTTKNLIYENDYYLDESILSESESKYSPVNYSGVSIKISDSNSFQILKLTPLSFKELFKDPELGAGACLYCQKVNELEKNKTLINGWLASIEGMEKYFSELVDGTENFYLDKDCCKRIKNFSVKKISEIIESSEEIKEKIFNGIGIYEEPYTAHYLFHGSSLKKLEYIPYTITTGSGRSRGDYTIVLKPK